MKLYLVENGNYTAGYFIHRENAENEVDKNNSLIEKFKYDNNVDKDPYYIAEIETED